MHLKGCVWEKGQWLLYSLDLDCLDLWAWASVTLLLNLSPWSSPKNLPFLLCWWAVTLSLPLGLLHPSLERVTRDHLAASGLAGLCTISRTFCALHAAGKLTCMVPKAAIRAFLLWEGVRFSPARVPRPPARGFFLAAPVTDLSQKPWPSFLSSSPGTKLAFQRLIFISKQLFSGYSNPF